MFNLILHTALLVLAAFILGAILGCLLRRFFGSGSSYGSATRSTPAQTAAAAATATVAAKTASTADADAAAKAKADADAAAAAAKKKADAAAAKAKAKAKADADAAAAKAKADADAAAAAADEPMDEAAMGAALAALPADATNEDKANAVGARPAGLAAPIGGKKDNLQRIKGIGKVNEGKLNDLGIYHFSQIRDWSASEARWVGTFLAFVGRIEREDWIGQADVLAAGGETDFAKRVDKGEVATSSRKKK